MRNWTRLDPTRTTMLRRRFIAEMKRRFAKLSRLVQELIVDDDVLGLRTNMPLTFHAKEMEAGYWFTTETGAHVFVREGQSKEDAIKERFGGGKTGTISAGDIKSIPTEASGGTLTKGDVTAIGSYTNRGYSEIVQAQLGKKLGEFSHYTNKEALTEASKVEKALLKMDGWSGTSYRGMKFGSEKEKQSFMEHFSEGAVCTFKAFQSTSMNVSVAKGFAGSMSKSILLEITGKSGRDVSALSWVPRRKEQEVLYMKGASFKITGMTKSKVRMVEL